MKKAIILSIGIFLLFIFMSSCKSVVVKPNDFDFCGYYLRTNNTFEYYSVKRDNWVDLVNLGTYAYNNDTLELYADRDAFIKQTTTPIAYKCEKNLLTIHLKTFESSMIRSGIMDDTPLRHKIVIKGVTTSQDTVELWSLNLSRRINSRKVIIDRMEHANVESIWLEMNETVVNEPIVLPKSSGCLDVSIPILADYSIESKLGTNETDKFILRKRGNNYYVESIRKKETYKLEKCK